MPTGVYRRPSLEERFWDNVVPDPNSGCWLWLGCSDGNGYGDIWSANTKWKAHRLSYALHNPQSIYGLVVRHKCDTPACVNPDHLCIGTQADNVADAVSRGRLRGNTKTRGELHHASKLTAQDVNEIRRNPSKPTRYWADKFGVSRSTVKRVRNGTLWTEQK